MYRSSPEEVLQRNIPIFEEVRKPRQLTKGELWSVYEVLNKHKLRVYIERCKDTRCRREKKWLKWVMSA